MESSRRRLLIGGLATLLAAQCLYGILTLATLYKSYKTSLVFVQAIASEKFSLDLSRADISASDFKTLNGQKIGVLMGTEPEVMLAEWEEKYGLKTEHVERRTFERGVVSYAKKGLQIDHNSSDYSPSR